MVSQTLTNISLLPLTARATTRTSRPREQSEPSGKPSFAEFEADVLVCLRGHGNVWSKELGGLGRQAPRPSPLSITTCGVVSVHMKGSSGAKGKTQGYQVSNKLSVPKYGPKYAALQRPYSGLGADIPSSLGYGRFQPKLKAQDF